MEAEYDYSMSYLCLIKQSYYQALFCLQAAAEQDYLMAQLWLERLYHQGFNSISVR